MTPAADRDEHALEPRTDELEEEIEEAFDRVVEEGAERLHRPFETLFATGAVGGLEVGLGVLALLAVERATGEPLIAGLAFSVGFLALLLGHSELFTEGFLVPVLAVASKRATAVDLLRLWGGTLVANLAGGWVISWVIMNAFPHLHRTALHAADYFVTSGFTLRAFLLAVLAGSTMTLMTRMQHGTESMEARIVAAIAGAWLLAGLQLFHSILDSIIIFAGLNTGHAPYGYFDWFQWFSWVVFGNLVGGVGLVTVLRLVRSRRRLQLERRTNDGG